MPTNNFKLFDENKANMMSDTDYAANQQRLNGVQSGIASSQLQNKTLYQTALMCYALAQIMAANGYDANDANAVSTFVNNLSLSMVQKVVDKASDEDISSGNDNKWVSANGLLTFRNSLIQIGTYTGNGRIYVGYKRTFQFEHLPKILLRYPTFHFDSTVSGYSTINSDFVLYGNSYSNYFRYGCIIPKGVEYLLEQLSIKKPDSAGTQTGSSFASKISFIEESNKIEIELQQYKSVTSGFELYETGTGNLDRLFENGGVKYIYVGIG